ncbi:isopenicillin N synthase family dioxygenase [Aestuariivirga sp.]|uniref:isopenicillin N synthase family dioxygenase n=1 Tax=Aestuariivirga sp. TaxID=2650926 RepID=UPI0039E6CCF7
MLLSPRSLPTLDFSRLSGKNKNRQAFLAELRDTARSLGFFYLTGHGIDAALVDEVLALSRKFFSLPEDDKLEIQMVKSPQFRGYNRAGLEHTRGKPDWREQVDIGPEQPARPIDRSAPAWTRLIGPNQWPSALPELKSTLLRYQDDVTALGIRITEALAESLGQDPKVFAPIYTPAPNQLLKIIRYPGRKREDGDQGVGAHKDSGFVTVLLQDRVGGLQVEGPDGWIEAPPVPGTFIVNIGELLEMASGGYLRANVHRVVSPPEGGDRLSVAFFLGARLDSTVPVLDLPIDLAAHVRGVTQDAQNPLFREVAKNYLKSRLRSHPDVARAHHADLLDPAERNKPLAAASAY